MLKPSWTSADTEALKLAIVFTVVSTVVATAAEWATEYVCEKWMPRKREDDKT